ncbi:hypothetical protein [Tannerella forsythia]|uniref:Uncharacterized protein n=1 Tax=Tannerella forsythia TaxID=28112 RepID=A0A3P1XRL9_TANFO|nr:hypothetical protein [Tannerella forsythia]RRD60548.1 hypothetical protein EII40_07090 [Tannerella forsythia]
MGSSEAPVGWFFITRRVFPNVSASDSGILTVDLENTPGTFTNYPTPASERIHGWFRTTRPYVPNYLPIRSERTQIPF